MALAAGMYLAIVWLGQKSREAISDRPRYTVTFNDIVCDTPPDMDRATFLAEVRYVSTTPMEFSSVDATIPVKLAEAFGKHPWVLRATPNDAVLFWPKPVKLEFRIPALVVITTEGPRVVDSLGVLLPPIANVKNLPVFLTMQAAPATPAGERWRNADVFKAIDLARDHQAKSLEKLAQGWQIEQTTGRILNISR